MPIHYLIDSRNIWESLHTKNKSRLSSKVREMTLAEKIISVISEQPGLKARKIAERLDVDKKAVNSLLHGLLKGKVRQDNTYRWYPVAGVSPTGAAKSSVSPNAQTDTPLARLCRYYLDCLAQENDQGVSVFAASKFGDEDYAQLNCFPGYGQENVDPFSVEGVDRIVRKVKASRGQSELYLGYPVRLRKHRARSGWEGCFMEPVMLWPCSLDEYGVALDDDQPFFNFKVLKTIGAGGEVNHLEEAVALNEELGLNSTPGEGPEIDELASRLRTVRPEWDWQESIDVSAILAEPSLGEIGEQGIYNKAVLVPAERSPYTRGLESELKSLSNLTEDQYRDTALGHWLACSGDLDDGKAAEPNILEVIPLNTEQRDAVAKGLTETVSVITGPPGTGKSQVVTGLLTNAIWTGTTALFASKNNKAVDVVHDRVNGLSASPSLLRMGNNEKDFALAEHLIGLLSTVASPDDVMEYESALERQQNLFEIKEKFDSDVDDVRQARNRVDALDRELAEYRDAWGEDVFDLASRIDLDDAFSSVQHLVSALKRARKSAQSLPIRALWRVFSGSRLRAGSAAWAEARPRLNMLGLETNIELDEANLPNSLSIGEEYERRLDVALRIQDYKAALSVLESKPTLEELSRKSYDLKQKIAANSEGLWHYWMALQSARLTDSDRKTLAMYSSTLQAMIESRGDDPKAARQIARRYYKIFPEIRSLLPCWAVTSLSAKGKVPFAPGFFDLLIIDEASQCDIASALPLLYRSKRAVVIGDPMQLKHISGITVEKDYRLQEKHGVSDEYAGWSYCTNSLFNLAVGIISAKELTMLRDHHRSHADIINFSNEFFYKGKLRVATRYDRLKRPAPNSPAVIWTNQPGTVRRPANGGAVNAQEADAVVAEIAGLLSRGYEGTIGVVTPFRAQANLIRRKITASDALSEQLVRSDLIVDTVHRFQGDERDVMFFSPVVARGISTGALGFLRSNGNLFNVAITRARSLLQVVGDKNAALESGVGYLSAFAEYSSQIALDAETAEVPQPELGREYPPVSHPERVSDWERIFYVALYDEGIRAIPQYDVEQYTLDFAVFDGDRKLNIEVDGERYHRDWTGELCRRDQIRNQRMIEMGWEVKRFWVYQIRDQRPQCVNWISHWLSK